MITCPVRIDLSAGWPDSDPYRSDFGGAVFSVAIGLRVSSQLKDGNLITSLGKIPGNSGLGTSGALRAAYLAASNNSLLKDRMDLIHRVWRFENDVIGHRAGFQDEAAAIYGGVNLWEFHVNGAIKRKSIPKDTAKSIEDHLILVYTGESHLSSSVHDAVFSSENYERSIEILDEMKSIARGMYSGFGNQDFFVEQMQDTWKLQKALSPEIETENMKIIQKKVKGSYEACKATGAGGGGCMVFFVKDKGNFKICFDAVEDDLPEEMKIIPFNIDFEGIKLE